MAKKLPIKSIKSPFDKTIPFDVKYDIKRNDNIFVYRTLTTKHSKIGDKTMKKIITDQKVINEVIDSFARTTEEIFSLKELKKLLVSGRQLRMKYGVDVTAPHMHIGHAVNLWMYRRLQELGHKLIFLIGDFTTQIGDPTGKSQTRPIIPEEEIQKNADVFIGQAMKVVHDDPVLVEVRRNSEWLETLPTKQFLKLMMMITHDRLASRDMFRKRMKEKEDIYMHEMVYPIIQGYDSVVLQADLTIVGTDQLYNEMLGRFYQEKFNQQPQVVITTKITPGINGKEKQSKSLGNYIGLGHSPREKFGRVMSIPDNLIILYLEVYTNVSEGKIAEIKRELAGDPMKWKLFLAEEIVKRYHGSEAATIETEWFKKTFSKREVPEEIPQISIGKNSADIFKILRQCFSAKEKSNSDIRRLIKQGAVKVDGETIVAYDEEISLSVEGVKVKVGKRGWFKVTS